MCVGIPMQVIAVEGIAARATDGHEEQLIDLSLIGPVTPGTWLLTFLGTAQAVIGADEAARIAAALDSLRSIMAGGDAGDAFADLEATGPRLPPHLQAAFDAGETIA